MVDPTNNRRHYVCSIQARQAYARFSETVRPPVLFTYDVVDLAPKERVILVDEAVFAKSISSEKDETEPAEI